MWKLTAMLRRAGRRRGIETDAERIQQLFRQEAPRQLPFVEDVMGKQALALLLQLDAACEAVDELARATAEAFRSHPDAVIMLSFPGIGPQVGARILGEIGDDRSRFATAGRTEGVHRLGPDHARFRQWPLRGAPVRQEQPAQPRRPPVGLRLPQRLRWHGPPYRRRRAGGDWHMQALRHLFNRMLGQLHHCLLARISFDEAIAFPPEPQPAGTATA